MMDRETVAQESPQLELGNEPFELAIVRCSMAWNGLRVAMSQGFKDGIARAAYNALSARRTTQGPTLLEQDDYVSPGNLR